MYVKNGSHKKKRYYNAINSTLWWQCRGEDHLALYYIFRFGKLKEKIKFLNSFIHINKKFQNKKICCRYGSVVYSKKNWIGFVYKPSRDRGSFLLLAIRGGGLGMSKIVGLALRGNLTRWLENFGSCSGSKWIEQIEQFLLRYSGVFPIKSALRQFWSHSLQLEGFEEQISIKGVFIHLRAHG